MRYAPKTDEEGDLSSEERDKLIENLARKIVDRRLETPAILFLEMHKPVAFLGSQALLVASPILAPLFGMEGPEKYSRLFSSIDNVEKLIQRIEDLSEERESER
ncbi:MAG TPA: hypothetical protein VFI02_01160 [Armatimonadota bacterium]|nr:hypothetical protein [Armatimonadota bacterium]